MHQDPSKIPVGGGNASDLVVTVGPYPGHQARNFSEKGASNAFASGIQSLYRISSTRAENLGGLFAAGLNAPFKAVF